LITTLNTALVAVVEARGMEDGGTNLEALTSGKSNLGFFPDVGLHSDIGGVTRDETSV
jgi:hypothetical protein